MGRDGNLDKFTHRFVDRSTRTKRPLRVGMQAFTESSTSMKQGLEGAAVRWRHVCSLVVAFQLWIEVLREAMTGGRKQARLLPVITLGILVG